MRGAVLIEAYQSWECPNCWATDTTVPLPPNASQFHACPGLHGLNAPLIRSGSGAKVTAVLRDDYEGREVTHHGDDRRSYMAVRTERPDGSNDVAVLAPCATAIIG